VQQFVWCCNKYEQKKGSDACPTPFLFVRLWSLFAAFSATATATAAATAALFATAADADGQLI
jgi:hypothetical protein